MVSHNHPRFSDLSFDPHPMPIDSMLRADAYDSTAVHDTSHWLTCHECGTVRVQRLGQTCGICRTWLLRKEVANG